MGWLLAVRILPFCRTVFCLFAGPIFTIGEFFTTPPPNYRVFKKLQGTTGRGEKSAKNSFENKKLREFFRGEALPFMRKSATVYA